MGIHYRHEWKHHISYSDLIAIRQRMSAIAKSDPHAIDGKYYIRSLYFDNLYDKALREKMDGTNPREKFRIRYYNHDPYAVIHLEKKSKVGSLGTKYSAHLSYDEAQKIVDGDIDWMMDSDQPLIKELYCKMLYQGMRPRVIVDYTREPFIYDPGNVRVTLDYDVRTGLDSIDFLNPKTITIPAGDPHIILEVKWDEFLPEIIRAAVQLKGIRTGGFSKFEQCRIYEQPAVK